MTLPDRNRTTDYEYNGDGKLRRLIARNEATGDQVTEWVYGTTLDESGVATFELVREKVYPDSTGANDRVQFGYNRLGELTGLLDQNGTQHAYGYDGLGRLVYDQTPELGTYIEGAVRQVVRRYHPTGQLAAIGQSDSNSWPDPSLVDEVRFTYNGFGQVTVEQQSHDGPVVAGTPQVEYTYADGSANTVRREGVKYPDGREIEYYYGVTNSLDDRADRVQAIRENGTALVSYLYRGERSTVRIGYAEPEVEMTYLRQSGMPLGDGGDRYTGLDRFNRIEDIRWWKDGVDVDRYQYGFDRAGNRTWRRHVNAPDTTVVNGGWDEAYAYDGLYQLRALGRGDLNQNQTWIAAIPKWQENYTFDPTGNWPGYQTLVDGAETLEQARTHNAANEITAIDGSNLLVAYDAAGNMARAPKVGQWNAMMAMHWDAWNRLVRVDFGDDPKAHYRYDGMSRRMSKYLPQESLLRHYYYSDQWQVLEERVGTEATTAERQFVWGPLRGESIVVFLQRLL
jgi:YD repeat-containing protein